jgi:hypothetical protein
MPNVTATTTAVQILLPESPETGDTKLYLQNRGAVEVFLGPTSAVTAGSGTNSGIGLAAGTIFEFPGDKRGGGYDLWAITASGSAEVRWVRL